MAPPTWRLRNGDPNAPASAAWTGRIDSGSSDWVCAAATATSVPDATTPPTAHRASRLCLRSVATLRPILGPAGSGAGAVTGTAIPGLTGSATLGAAPASRAALAVTSGPAGAAASSPPAGSG